MKLELDVIWRGQSLNVKLGFKLRVYIWQVTSRKDSVPTPSVTCWVMDAAITVAIRKSKREASSFPCVILCMRKEHV